MNNKLSFLLGFLVLLNHSAVAHHSFSMFDQAKKVTIVGTVADVQWTNPHVWVEVDVAQSDGSTVRWGIEFTSRVHLTRRGFSRDLINVGDHVEFTVSPYADGRPGGRFWTVRLANGEYYRDPGAQMEYRRTQAAKANQQKQ